MLVNAIARFCNEIGRRDYVTDKIFSLDDQYAQTKSWGAERKAPLVYLLLSEEGALSIAKHVEFYVWKGLLKKVTGIKGVSDSTGVKEDMIRKTLIDYASSAKQGIDDFGKSRFVARTVGLGLEARWMHTEIFGSVWLHFMGDIGFCR